jgi:hypothetical protein
MLAIPDKSTYDKKSRLYRIAAPSDGCVCLRRLGRDERQRLCVEEVMVAAVEVVILHYYSHVERNLR